jgi:excinuclease UvrABC nuclease subunit
LSNCQSLHLLAFPAATAAQFKSVVKENRIELLDLLYVGEAGNMNNRLTQNHEKIPQARKLLANEEVLLLIWAEVPNQENRELAEKAIIAAVKPSLNDKVVCPKKTATYNAVYVSGHRHSKIPENIPLAED